MWGLEGSPTRAKSIMSKVKASETKQSIQEARMRAPWCRVGLEEITQGCDMARGLREVIPRQGDEQQFRIKPIMDLAKLDTPSN